MQWNMNRYAKQPHRFNIFSNLVYIYIYSQRTILQDSCFWAFKSFGWDVCFQESCKLTLAPSHFLAGKVTVAGERLEASFCQPLKIMTHWVADRSPLLLETALRQKKGWPLWQLQQGHYSNGVWCMVRSTAMLSICGVYCTDISVETSVNVTDAHFLPIEEYIILCIKPSVN